MRGSVQMGESRISRMGTNGFSNGSVRGLLERCCSAMRQASPGQGLAGEWEAREWGRCRGSDWPELFVGMGTVAGTPEGTAVGVGRRL
jgi:hypothetical protein